MQAYIFPGQGAQFEGMGKDLYEAGGLAKELFDEADHILGYSLSEIMFHGSAEALKQTKVTQPAIFLHSVIKAKIAGEAVRPDVVAGHSLGEFSALVANDVLGFTDGLQLVQKRALAMERACQLADSTMAAIVGLEDAQVEDICHQVVDEVVVPANYNCPGQLVISGTVKGINRAIPILKAAGARRAIILQVSGAFHSPLMEPAKAELEQAISATNFYTPTCPIYQNVNARRTTDSERIQRNLIEQLTAPVKWTQSVENMMADGVTSFTEIGGTGKVLRGMILRVNRRMPVASL